MSRESFTPMKHTRRDLALMQISLLGESASRRTDSQNVGQQRLFGTTTSVRAGLSSSVRARVLTVELARTQSQKHAASHTWRRGQRCQDLPNEAAGVNWSESW